MSSLSRGSALLRQRSIRSAPAWRAVRSQPALRRWVHEIPPQPEIPTQPPKRGGPPVLGLLAAFGASAGAFYYLYPKFASPAKEHEAPKKIKKVPKATPVELPSAASLEDVPIKSSWDHPGVYAWGSNAGRVIDATSNEAIIKTPRRIAFFDDQILRDLKLKADFGAAINEKGDLVLWGTALSTTHPEPIVTLQGKDLVKLALSSDRVIALSSAGAVYSIPVSRQDQLTGQKVASQSSFWGSPSKPESINYRLLTPTGLKGGEKVVEVSSGLEHCLMLTSKGRVFSAAASTLEFPSKGQLGVPGLTWETRPVGNYDQAHELTTLPNSPIVQIAAGDLHSVLLNKAGKVFVFGDNIYGQLGFTTSRGHQYVDTPVEIQLDKLYAKTDYVPRATSIAAGGMTTFFTVDAVKALTSAPSNPSAKDSPPQTFDVWACGSGLFGTLGTGKFVHAAAQPMKVKSLSSVFEFDESTDKLAPVKISHLSAGTTHACAVLDAKVSARRSRDGVNHGGDVLFWGGNEQYQLGTGKRTNLNTPSYVAGLNSTTRNTDDALIAGGDQRLQLAPRRTVRLEDGKGRKVSTEQKVECGGLVTAVYSSV
ncbi:hypothetical protein jhhlp_002990 [Lomentospora prolificans]|uniref:Uncharacterized protein n=1 Tax=Lomentospora prolificans TaxID=41688 RepID=A0A2N3NFK8_9PEZI|nr:hypothetical protein jhhlp_002990 [Lomentospora prolificans]